MAGRSLSVSVLFLLAIVLICNLPYSYGEISCKDNNGNSVDWFVVYKLPRNKSSFGDVATGLAFYYMDVNHQHWELNPRNINETGQAVQYTLQQAYDNAQSKDVAYIFYNDETPEKNVSYSNGHTKGDVVFDKHTGFWLVHSVPRFPPYIKNSFSYPYSGLTYGQSMLCVTYSYKQLNTIGDQLKYNYPQVYDYNLPASIAEDNPSIRDVVNGKHTTDKTWNGVVKLGSFGGSQSFTSFAKYTRYDADLYAALVAPYYKQDLLVESWRNGGTPLPSNCTGSAPTVKNVDYLKFTVDEFKYTKDHSKWAVADRPGVTCIGDINREKSQERRAGGTVCFDNPHVWKAFRSIVTISEPCP